MRKIFETVVSIWLALILTSCGAVQYAQDVQVIDPAATLKGMSQAINGQAGTYVLQQGEYLLLGWPAGTKYGWVIFNQAGDLTNAAKFLCGNKACPEAASEFYNWLMQNGWTSISAGAVPGAISSTVRQLTYLLSIGASFPMIPVLLMPLQLDPMQILKPEVKA